MTPQSLTKKLVYRGDNEEMSLLFQLQEGEELSYYDLTTWKEIKMSVRRFPNFSFPSIVDLTTEDGTLEIANLIDPETGEVTAENCRLLIHLNSEKTLNFTAGNSYFFDIRFVGMDDEVVTMLKGEITSTYNITN